MLFVIVLISFGFMLVAIFFGDYKRVRSRVKREREGFISMAVNSENGSCENCSGNCDRQEN